MDKLRIRENLYKQFLEGKYCDLHIQVESSYFKAHSCVVAAASWVLEAILQSSAAEDPNLSKLSIQLHGVTAYAISSLLSFIYTGKFPIEIYNDVEKRKELLHAAKLYKMDEIPSEFNTSPTGGNSGMTNLQILESGNLNDSLLENFAPTETHEKSGDSSQSSVDTESDGNDNNEMSLIQYSEDDLENSEAQKAVKEHVLQTVDYAKTHGILYCVICTKILPTQMELLAHMSEHGNIAPRPRRRPERAAAVASRVGSVASLIVETAHDDDDDNFDDYPVDTSLHLVKKSPRKRKRGTPKSKTFACGKCAVTYTAKGHLIRHYNTHHPESLFCKYCAEHFETTEQLQLHITTHGEESETNQSTNGANKKGKKVYTCNLCSTSFMKKKELVEHQMKIHGILKPMHLCTTCGKEFKEKSSLRAHTRVHTGEKPYMCSFCGNSFADQKTWKDHERRHRGEKPFLCTTCGKSFTYRQSFTRHMKFHEGKRPFQCSICGKAFVLRQNLKEHEKRHNK